LTTAETRIPRASTVSPVRTGKQVAENPAIQLSARQKFADTQFFSSLVVCGMYSDPEGTLGGRAEFLSTPHLSGRRWLQEKRSHGALNCSGSLVAGSYSPCFVCTPISYTIISEEEKNRRAAAMLRGATRTLTVSKSLIHLSITSHAHAAAVPLVDYCCCRHWSRRDSVTRDNRGAIPAAAATKLFKK